MTYVIAKGCCNDASCVSVCPVDCIRPRPSDPEFKTAEQLYIDPASCIDCAACMWECPVSAIHDENDMPSGLDIFRDINAEYFEHNPLRVTETARTGRRKLPETRPKLRVAIVGAGASGCYAAEALAVVPGVEVSLFDRLPTPYGLIRAGVAPDHQKTKSITKQFEKVLKRPNVHSYFNVELGKHITVEDLLEWHHAVIVSVGADDDRKLGIPGEDLPGSYSAREFVAWYNGSPSHADSSFDLTGEQVVLIGNGNVALDVARVLAERPKAFAATDMTDYAIDALESSGVREVMIVARRGIDEAAFTTSELHALTELDGVDVVIRKEEVEADVAAPLSNDSFGTRGKRDLASRICVQESGDADRKITFRFRHEPVSINGDTEVESITFRSTLDESVEETIKTRLVLRAIGYRTSPTPGVPFDPKKGTIPNDGGRVVNVDMEHAVQGLYCTGWAKRGATGVIGTSKWCSIETVNAIFEDFEQGLLRDPAALDEEVLGFVASRQPELIDLEGWLRIDAAERLRGAEAPTPKPRRKFHSLADMLSVGLGQRA
ncbi:FAD-dependent oxidoreductase [Arthrobacter sp. EPSL27]|uniref:FAD-dependent oxidoreductase n=1 Tax=Arthrobacter sp. EPSL27 TaxID=1745378 RepID=UPI0007495932|nr:FAD-dependent oxidoreductase [Arthrobacter sp. EPSL27]KUM37413.1 hypothetical protein AR539_09120 [Arthrobacter sp. EPSL27]